MAIKMRILITSILFLSFGLTASVQAVTYKWTNDSGNVVYSQQPPEDDRQFQRIKGLKKYQASPTENPEEESATNADSAKNSEETKETGYSEEDIARRKEMKEKNCKSAKEALDLYTVHKRFRDKDGNITTMSEAERQANIEKAENAVKEYCN